MVNFLSDGNKEFMVGKKENEHKIHSSNYEGRESGGKKHIEETLLRFIRRLFLSWRGNFSSVSFIYFVQFYQISQSFVWIFPYLLDPNYLNLDGCQSHENVNTFHCWIKK